MAKNIANKKKVYNDEVNLNDYDLTKGKKFDLEEFMVESNLKREILHMRIDPKLVDWLKSSAEKEGMAYQTYVHHKLTQLMNGKLTDPNADIIRRIERLEKKLKIA
jgi:predicted DNA binding CopG/RHH family protein